MMKELFLRDSAESCVESPFLPPQKVGTQFILESSLRKVSKYLWQTILQSYTITYFLRILRNSWNLLKILRFYCYLRMTSNEIAVISSLQYFAESFCEILCVKYGEILRREDFYA